MTTTPPGAGDYGSASLGLAHASTALHPDDLPAVVAEHARLLGAADFTIYVADLEQKLLIALTSDDRAEPDQHGVDTTVAGRAYRTERPVVAPGGGDGDEAGVTVWMPLLDSSERIGVVSLRAAADPTEDQLHELQGFVNQVAELVANKEKYGDRLLRARRTQDVTMAAELRWAMLPPLTYTGRNVTLSGIVEPAYEIAGDTFDYALNGDAAHVAIIDAVGHGLEASRIANLAVIAYRHSRRRDLGLVDTYQAMDAVVAEQFGSEKFATAQLAVLTLSTGALCWLNAGHPPPLVIRQGHRVDLVSEPCLPVGLAGAAETTTPAQAETSLEPGDLVLFFTDGIVEARSADGEEFGREGLVGLMERAAAAGQTAAETVRMLGHAVMAHHEGVLQDDATLLLVAWHGPATDA